MALGILEILRRCGRVDPDALVARFVERFETAPGRGYGTMTRLTLESISIGIPWQHAARSAFSGRGSMGNGAAMRVAPLGAYFADDLPTVIQEATTSAVVTHAHPEGQAGAIASAVAAALAWRLRGRLPEQAAAELLQAVYGLTPPGQTRQGLARALDLPRSAPAPEAAKVLGSGFLVTAPDTVPYVVWCAAKHLDDYVEAILDMVSGDGDCDTNCAMVGGIVALFAGRSSIPDDWLAAREELSGEA